MTAGSEIKGASVVDRIVEHAAATLPDGSDLEACIRVYFAHVDEADLESRHVPDLFGMVADHLQLVSTWHTGTVAIRVTNPRIEVDGWESDHTLVQIVMDDVPFLVASVSMELTRRAIGIHFVTHPIMCRRDSDAAFVIGEEPNAGQRLVSLISVEIARQATPEDRQLVEDDLVRVLEDVRAAVRDWQPMHDRMNAVSADLDTADLPISEDEVTETRELLNWLADDHFIFLGARDYALGEEDGVEVLRIVPDSGLGVLARNVHLGHARPLSDFGPTARQRVRERRLLNLTKASSRSTVQRASYLDYVGIKTFDDAGNVSGERRFLGLFTSEVYSRSVYRIPRARRTVAEVIKQTNYPVGGHAENQLKTILEQYPRDDLLQMDADELCEIAVGIAGLQERRRVRIFSRREIFGRFVTALVYLPRDRYTTEVRTGIQDILSDAYGGTLAEWDAELSESVLARLRFVMRVGDDQTDVDPTDLEEQIEALIRLWDDGLVEAMVNHFGDDEALRLGRIYETAFGPDYQRAFEPRTASADMEQIEELGQHGALRLSAYREPGNAPSAFKLKLYRRGERVSLTTVMPSLTNLGVTVVHERPYELRPAGQEPVWVYDFALEHDTTTLDFVTASTLIADAFEAVWSGAVEDDGLNRLVLAAGMDAADVSILRAYARYLRQVGLGYSRLFVEQTLETHPAVASQLVELFVARFDPDSSQESEVAWIEARLDEAIGEIESLDQDRVLRRFYNLISGRSARPGPSATRPAIPARILRSSLTRRSSPTFLSLDHATKSLCIPLASRVCTCEAGPSLVAVCGGRSAPRTTEPRFSDW